MVSGMSESVRPETPDTVMLDKSCAGQAVYLVGQRNGVINGGGLAEVSDDKLLILLAGGVLGF